MKSNLIQIALCLCRKKNESENYYLLYMIYNKFKWRALSLTLTSHKDSFHKLFKCPRVNSSHANTNNTYACMYKLCRGNKRIVDNHSPIYNKTFFVICIRIMYLLRTITRPERHLGNLNTFTPRPNLDSSKSKNITLHYEFLGMNELISTVSSVLKHNVLVRVALIWVNTNFLITCRSVYFKY